MAWRASRGRYFYEENSFDGRDKCVISFVISYENTWQALCRHRQCLDSHLDSQSLQFVYQPSALHFKLSAIKVVSP